MPGLFSWGIVLRDLGTDISWGLEGARPRWPSVRLSSRSRAATTQTAAAPEAEPIHFEMFAHGRAPAGEAQIHEAAAGSYMTMDRKAPTSDVPKSLAFLNAGAASPNDPMRRQPRTSRSGSVRSADTSRARSCSSSMSSLPPEARPGCGCGRTWARVGCDEDYREPSATTVVEMPVGSGKVSAVMRDVNFEAATNVMVQVSPATPDASQARILLRRAEHAHLTDLRLHSFVGQDLRGIRGLKCTRARARGPGSL